MINNVYIYVSLYIYDVFQTNVVKTIINHPPVIAIFIGGINLPFPVSGMGGKHDIVLTTLQQFQSVSPGWHFPHLVL